MTGRFLQDTSNKNVLLHGWMQPTASWLKGEGQRYCDPTDWTDPANYNGMLSYMRDAPTGHLRCSSRSTVGGSARVGIRAA